MQPYSVDIEDSSILDHPHGAKMSELLLKTVLEPSDGVVSPDSPIRDLRPPLSEVNWDEWLHPTNYPSGCPSPMGDDVAAPMPGLPDPDPKSIKIFSAEGQRTCQCQNHSTQCVKQAYWATRPHLLCACCCLPFDTAFDLRPRPDLDFEDLLFLEPMNNHMARLEGQEEIRRTMQQRGHSRKCEASFDSFQTQGNATLSCSQTTDLSKHIDAPIASTEQCIAQTREAMLPCQFSG